MPNIKSNIERIVKRYQSLRQQNIVRQASHHFTDYMLWKQHQDNFHHHQPVTSGESIRYHNCAFTWFPDNFHQATAAILSQGFGSSSTQALPVASSSSSSYFGKTQQSFPAKFGIPKAALRHQSLGLEFSSVLYLWAAYFYLH